MNGEGSGLRERIRRAIEAPVDESQKLLSELKDASPETQLSVLISGWARGLAAGLEELAIAVDELLEREGRAHREPAAATAGEEPAFKARPQEERSSASVPTSSADAGQEELLQQARESREQTAELRKETERLRDELAP